jgi:hypothetical protein
VLSVIMLVMASISIDAEIERGKLFLAQRASRCGW